MALFYLFLIYYIIFQINCVRSEPWNYDKLGPDYWKKKWPDCGNHFQSPINILTDSVVYDEFLSDIIFNKYDIFTSWTFTNDGETIKALPINISTQLSIILNDATYLLEQFHLHWGFNDYQGSEHLINYEKFPLEIHLVHKSNQNKTAVLAFLFQLSDYPNPRLASISNIANSLAISHTSKNLSLILGSILPDEEMISSDGYYRYGGSFTTPPCSGDVLWTVFRTKINISSSQLQPFRNNARLANFRDFQPIYERKVYTNFKNNSNNIKKFSFLISVFIMIINNFFK